MSSVGSDVKNDVIPKPSAKEILLYADCLATTSRSDNNVAVEALQKWIDGELTKQDVERYKAILQLPEEDIASAHLTGSTAECAACLAACCGVFGCNPACIAGCVAGICK